MPANLGTEAVTVQHPLTRYAGQAGWTIVPKEEATTLRRGESGLFFYDLLKQKLQDLNPDWPAHVRGTLIDVERRLGRAV